MAQGYSPLFAALQGAQYSPEESPLGIGAMALSQATPMLYNPYASTGSNAAYTIGAGLLSGLLGGLAKRDANRKNAEFFKLANSLRSASPEQASMIIDQEPRLTNYGMALQEIKDQRQAELADMQMKAQFELGNQVALENVKGKNQRDVEVDKRLADYGLIRTSDGKLEKLTKLAAGLPELTQVGIGGATQEELALPLIKPEEARKIELDYTTQLTSGKQAERVLSLNKAAGNILDALEKDSPLAASTAIVEYAKAQDPIGSVREGDELRVSDPGGPLGALARIHNEIMQKGKLTPEAKQSMRELVPILLTNEHSSYSMQKDALLESARKQGANPSNIQFYSMPDLNKRGASAATMPTVAGQILSREQFKAQLLAAGGAVPGYNVPLGDQMQTPKVEPNYFNLSKRGVPLG